MIDVEKLTEKYKKEEPLWSLQGVVFWLIEKKQIPKEIAEAALQVALLEMSEGKVIESHAGQHGFDNYVLKICRIYIEEIGNLTLMMMKKHLNEALSEYVGGNRWSKAWRALRGKL